MSFRVRIRIENALDHYVYYEGTVEATGDYREIPDLLDKAHDTVRRHVAQVGAYSIVHLHAFGSPRPEDAS